MVKREGRREGGKGGLSRGGRKEKERVWLVLYTTLQCNLLREGKREEEHVQIFGPSGHRKYRLGGVSTRRKASLAFRLFPILGVKVFTFPFVPVLSLRLSQAKASFDGGPCLVPFLHHMS